MHSIAKILSALKAASAGLCIAAPAIGTPPVVLETIPEVGHCRVDPALTELVVTFDQDMHTGGYSWAGGGELFPIVPGTPEWRNARTAVLPVALEPNHVYLVWVNSQNRRNFRSAAGESAAPLQLWFMTGPGDAESATDSSHKAAYDKLRGLIDTHYSHRDLLVTDWDAALARYAEPMARIQSPLQFAHLAAAALAPACDNHLYFIHEEELIPTHRREYEPNFSFETTHRNTPNFTKHSNVVFTGRFGQESGASIGYLLIGSWDASREADLQALEPAMLRLADCDALIIDMRANGGGSEILARRFARRFIDKAAVYATHRSIVPTDRPDSRSFGPVHKRTIEPIAGQSPDTRPIALLIGPACVSSTEAFILMMATSQRVTTMGSRTGGSTGNPQPHDLGNGVTAWIPSWIARSTGNDQRPEGDLIQGKGIDPDIEIETSPEDFTQGDPVIDVALAHLRAEMTAE